MYTHNVKVTFESKIPMRKLNLQFWRGSQPGETYYARKVKHTLFRILCAECVTDGKFNKKTVFGGINRNLVGFFMPTRFLSSVSDLFITYKYTWTPLRISSSKFIDCTAAGTICTAIVKSVHYHSRDPGV